MSNNQLAKPDPTAYRYAVHSCSYKLDLAQKPDRAVALFDNEALANTFGRLMWPSFYEVVDIRAGEES
ncbi:MAG: hypothetical protein ACOH2R_08425 [Pseudomonas sp.]